LAGATVFDTFETVVVFVSVLIIKSVVSSLLTLHALTTSSHSYAISDGKTNWLEGFVLMVVYVIIGLSVWYYVSVFVSHYYSEVWLADVWAMS
jgi:Ca2+:H+ antiporter